MGHRMCLMAGVMVLMTAAGCASVDASRIRPGLPVSIQTSGPPGPPEYEQGWKDGCNSGFSAFGWTFTKTWFRFYQDPDLQQNPIYIRVWRDAYNFCRTNGMTISMHGFGQFN